jgi:hypothetical protein
MKAMRAAVLYLAAGLAGGFALSALLSEDPGDFRISDAPEARGGLPLDSRIARLESRLDAVITENAALADELARLDLLLADTLVEAGADFEERVARAVSGESPEPATLEAGSDLRERFQQPRFRGEGRNLAERLTEAGFSLDEAQRIETRLEELSVEAMQQRYETQRSGEPQSVIDQLRNGSATLRAELGDADYERYLEATGRPTRVGVSSVLSSSAAQTAGIQPGDQIVAYGGERVFDVRELNQVLLEGEPGEPVVVDVERDGQLIQLVIPRGPLGISSGFARRGGR